MSKGDKDKKTHAFRVSVGKRSIPMTKKEANDRPSIQSLVRADLDAREQIGVQRYGTPLQAHNGRDVFRVLYEELLDAACYVRQVIEKKPLETLTRMRRQLSAAYVDVDCLTQQRDQARVQLAEVEARLTAALVADDCKECVQEGQCCCPLRGLDEPEQVSDLAALRALALGDDQGELLPNGDPQ